MELVRAKQSISKPYELMKGKYLLFINKF